jgi:hypothetical protein
MTELEELEVEANEALFNMGRLAERLGGDDGRRLVMLASTLMKYKRQLETRVAELEGKNDA